MNIIDFLKENEIKFLPIFLKIKNGKKTYLTGAAGCFIDGRQNFKKDDFDKWDFDDCVEFYEEYKEETNYIGIDCTQIQQLDIDDLTGTFKGSATEATYTKGPHFLSLTKEMPHIFMHTDYKGQHCAEIPFEHDVLSNVWAFAHIEQEIINDEEEIPTFQFTSKNIQATQATPNETMTNKDSTHKEKVVDLIKVVPYLDERASWSRIVWAMRNEGFSEEFARAISKKSHKYTDEGFENVWGSEGMNKITMGTLNYYARLSDDKEYIMLHTKNKPEEVNTDWTQMQLAKKFEELRGDDVVCQEKTLIVYFKEQWRIDRKGTLVKLMFSDTMSDYLKSFPNGVSVFSKALKVLQTSTPLNGCIDCLRCVVQHKLQEVCFDVGTEQYYNVHFRNGVYDLQTDEFRLRHKFDFVTKILDYDFVPKDKLPKAIVEDVNLLFRKLQPHQGQRDYLLSFHKYCLTGDTSKELANLYVGYTAANGKSTIINVHEKSFDVYTKKIDNRTFNVGFEKTHKQFFSIIYEPIRMVYMEEMSGKKEINAVLYNDFVDGTKLNVEILFGTTEEKPHQAKLVIPTNFDVQFPNNPGSKRRTGVVKFTSQFVDDLQEDDFEKHCYIRDQKFIDKFDDPLYKNAYFHLLVKQELNFSVPKENRENFDNMIDDYDVFSNHLADLFEITGNDNDRVSKDRLENLFHEKHIKWDEILREIKKLEKKGIKYEKGKRVHGKRGIVTGLKLLPHVPVEEKE